MVKAKDDKEFHDLAYFFAPKAPITVLYVGAWDCPPCTRWNNNEKKAWMETDSFKKVTFREVTTYTYKDTLTQTVGPRTCAGCSNPRTSRRAPRASL